MIMILAILYLSTFSLAAGTSNFTPTPIYQSVSNPISSPFTSDEGCEDWFYKIARLNRNQCPYLIRRPSRNEVVSNDGSPHKTYDGVTKLTDGKYRCQTKDYLNGCNISFLNWFDQQEFFILCQPIDGIETRLRMDRTKWLLLSGYGDDSHYRMGPVRTLMWCEKQDNHAQLVIARQETVNQARDVISATLGPDLLSCIDRHL